MSTEYRGVLEIDRKRGVIYFHSEGTGATLLRIQGLPVPIPEPTPGDHLDLQADEAHANWRGEKSRVTPTEHRR